MILGLSRSAAAKSRPSSSMAPGRRLCTSTSARLTRRCRTSSPPGDLRSRARLFLLRLSAMNVALSLPQYGGAHARASAPRPGRSTLMTSAPMSPRIWVQKGPATFCVRSATITLSSGGRTAGSLSSRGVGGRGLAGPMRALSHSFDRFRAALARIDFPPMAIDADELAQRLAALSERFAHLAQALSQAAQQAQSGAPPAESLIDEITSIRTEFLDVRQRVVEATKALSVNAPGMAEIDSLKALKPVVDAVGQAISAQAKRAALAEARTKVMAVLDRILAISHVDGPNFTSLAQCQAKAREIRQTAQDPRAFDSENAPAFLESTPSFAALLTMIENRDALDDDKFAALEDAVTQSFGKTLAVAATRG